MARLVCLIIASLGLGQGLSACAGPRLAGDASDSPAWLEERIEAAEASERGYPPLADIPTYDPPTTSRQAWLQGIADMSEKREALLSDPAIEDPDAEPVAAAQDSAAVARRTRAAAERDMRLQTADD